MAEICELAAPVTPPTLSTYRVSALTLDWDATRIDIFLRGTNGEELRHGYSGTDARDMMTFLNRANLTENSLHKRILNRLITDGVINGTISGSPD